MRGRVNARQISLNGPTKGLELLKRAVSLGVRVTLDSVNELERVVEAAKCTGSQAVVRLRVRPDFSALKQRSQLMPGMSSIHEAASAYKAGIPTEDLLRLAHDDLTRPELDVRGYMVHLGRHDASLETWTGMTTAFVDLIGALQDRWPTLNIRELDIGGGFPVPRDPFGRVDEPSAPDMSPRVPSVEAYAEAIVPLLAGGLRGIGLDAAAIALELEPGRSLFGDTGIHLTKVRNVKRERATRFPHTWVETDTSEIWLADVVLERNRWRTIVANRADADCTDTVYVVGTSCAPDVIVANEPMPPVETGDVIAFVDTGAYQEASASNFNALPRPATVLVHDDIAEIIRRAETIDDVFRRDIVPSRLSHGGDSDEERGWRVTVLDHVSVTTGDIDKSLAFYHELLGLELRDRGEMAYGELDTITGLSGTRVRWADLHLSDHQVLELLQYMSPVGAAVTSGDNDPGAMHISMRVQDIDAAYARLVKARVPAKSVPVVVEDSGYWNGARCFYAKDPDGVTVELIKWRA